MLHGGGGVCRLGKSNGVKVGYTMYTGFFSTIVGCYLPRLDLVVHL